MGFSKSITDIFIALPSYYSNYVWFHLISSFHFISPAHLMSSTHLFFIIVIVNIIHAPQPARPRIDGLLAHVTPRIVQHGHQTA